MWLRWLPWKFLLRRAARSKGFLDPLAVLARLQRFTQPSEVDAPLELLRAGMQFHARGLINSRAIQHNLDWVWPYWVERQFDPKDDAFTPRSFSITHVNLTHRNWTAVGLPDVDAFPIVDPRGLVTPWLDGWSLDAWVVPVDAPPLVPSRATDVTQRLEFEPSLAVVTRSRLDGWTLEARVEVPAMINGGPPSCRMRFRAEGKKAGWLAVALRPYNPEGVSLIHEAHLLPGRAGWVVDDAPAARFERPPDRHLFSHYRLGDVFARLPADSREERMDCDVGMVTAAALFAVKDGSAEISIETPLTEVPPRRAKPPGWTESLRDACGLRSPDARIQFLYDAALRTLVLHSPGDVYPGPYTYKRFWFRDAAFILNAMLGVGLLDRVERCLDRFPQRQTPDGYFLSQEGEWDSNGQALWILDRYGAMTGRAFKKAWREPAAKAARWIQNKRLPENSRSPHAGLLPPGFSAEHLGLNDYYYWDDFWGVAGLAAAGRLLGSSEFREGAARFMVAIERSLAQAAARLGRPAMPAAPGRRLDAGAIGSLAAGYPLALFEPDDARLLDTARFLMEATFVDGGFFQDMVHSGINPYLTLHVAQVLLRAGDGRFWRLMDAVAGLASPTGQWPEAVHPRTRGGCMGDGQHVWAAAEWVLMVRNCFLREEGARLILGAGIAPEWREQGALSFGPAPTPFGPVSVDIRSDGDEVLVSWTASWRGGASAPPPIEVRVPGFPWVTVAAGQNAVRLMKP